MKRWLLFLCALAAAVSTATRAQQYDLRTQREPIVSTAGTQWRFHPGDDAQWSSPNFDDTAWPLLKADTPWTAQGYKGVSGYAWYRFTIQPPPNTKQLSLRLPTFGTNYEVYADGQFIGGCGQMRPEPKPYRCRPEVYRLPEATDGKPITVALRVWHWPGWVEYFGGGPLRAARLGATPFIEKDHSNLMTVYRYSLVPLWVLSLLYFIGGVAALALYFWRRSEKEYLSFALMVLFEGALFGFSFYEFSHSLPLHTVDFIETLLELAGWVSGVAFFGELLHAQRNSFYRPILATLFLKGLLSIVFMLSPTLQLHVAAINIADNLVLLLPSTWIVLFLYKRAREHFIDALLLLIPVAILYGSGILGNLSIIVRQFGVKFTDFESFRVDAPFPVDISEFASFFFLISMLAILINRFTRTRGVEERYASEFESARHVQEVLVPIDFGSVPGFTIEAEYRPARSVGGDFYQVLPGTDGGVLIVVGDVAGKGMPAAMLVAMIVGAIRTQAVFSMDPANMLQSLNERLCGHSSGGFSTCLAAYISKEGDMTVANAGHLSPYLNGKEMSLEAELPLGLQAGITYESARFLLQQGDRLTFVSDGIVEASNAKRELFGFERTEAISLHPATEIILAAQAFGQNDDITVVTAAYGV